MPMPATLNPDQVISNELSLKTNSVQSKRNSTNDVGDINDISKIGSTLQPKDCDSIPLTFLNVQRKFDSKRDLVNVTSKLVEPSTPQSNTSIFGFNGSSAYFINQVPKLHGTSIPFGDAPTKSAGLDVKSFPSLFFNDGKNIEKPRTSIKSVASDSKMSDKSAMNKLLFKNSSTVQTNSDNCAMLDREQNVLNIPSENSILPTDVAVNICTNKFERSLIEVNKRKTSNEQLVTREELKEEFCVSDPMLILNDSADELQENENIKCQKSTNNFLSSTEVTHITNSVILTTTKSDNRSIGAMRKTSTEPANVVLMKLPNAAQQAVGITDSRIEIPITEAFIFSSENVRTKPINTISLETVSANTLESQTNTLLMRSNSIPKIPRTLSPRAAKRSQSLNCSQKSKLVTSPNKITVSDKFETSENQINSNQAFPIGEHPSTGKSTNSFIEKTESRSSSSSSLDEINKENNQVTFIDLEDSFADDISEDSNVPTSKSSHIYKIDEEKKDSNHNLEHDSKEKVYICQSTKKGHNAALKNISSPIQSQDMTSSHISCKISHLHSVVLTKNELAKNDNDKTNQKFFNEKIKATKPLSSSSPSKEESLPVCTFNFSQSSNRTALTPRFRDHNTLIDSNSSTARRLCRDSSIASALSMVSSFDMLNWKEDRIASARGTVMRFELNEFNLLQVHERSCPPRYRIHTPYEQPIYERYTSMPKTDQIDPLLYLCRKCKLYGPAVDFLAPEFCSVDCLKRTLGKRGSRDVGLIDKNDLKRSRGIMQASSMSKPINASKTSKQAPIFRWSTYLSNRRSAIAAPIDLFFNPFPTSPNPFWVGMKVEAIDPENCSLFCVCTIVQIQGYRLRLNFDGYNSVYDFWVNADSMDIFPPGWCKKTNRILQPPRGYEPNKFEWNTYLLKTNSIGADKKMFTHLNNASITNRNPFTVGMFLEADDLNDTGKLCVASVADVLDERIRVHFDGWDDCYDYWVDINSPYIHPCGWHEGRQQLLVPPEYSNTSFNWRDYIRDCQGLAAPTDFFVSRHPIDYRPGMKLEVVDPKNPSLIRPASIVHRTRHRIKIHLDCWAPEYTFCLEDDSPDLHPIGWCDATGHDLEPPPDFQQLPMIMPCETIGCRGLGNMDRTNGLTHANRECCPYVLENWRSKQEKLPRVHLKDIVRKIRLEGTPALRSTKNMKRPSIQSANTLQNQKPSGKLINIPHKQPRGRPRNCDRLAAAAAAASALREEQQRKLQSVICAEEIKIDFEEEINKKIRKQANISETQNKTCLPAEITTDLLQETAQIQIGKHFLCDYGPRLKQNYALWRRNANDNITSKVQRNPLLWSTAETCAFIDSILNEYKSDTARFVVSSKFLKHDIDGAALLMLQQQDFTDVLQFKIGVAVKLCSIVLHLRMLVASKYGVYGAEYKI